jgi:Na+/H+-dicarboxylate symporter
MRIIFQAYRRTSLLARILIGFGLGALLGILVWWWGAAAAFQCVKILAPLGVLLISMLKMIVIPVIFFSIITGAAQLSLKNFGRVGGKVIGWYLFTSLIATLTGVSLALVINPGSATQLSGWEQLSSSGLSDIPAIAPQTSLGSSITRLLQSLFQNPFEALATNNFLAIIVFALLFGLALRQLMDTPVVSKYPAIGTFLDLITVVREVIFKIVDWILEYSPIGIFCLTLSNFSQHGWAIVGPYVGIVISVISGVLFMMVLVYPFLMWLITRQAPYKIMRQMNEALLTAFITRSSAATLPVTFKTMENHLGVKKELTSFALPLGATINMDGVCVHLPIFAVLAANLFGIEITLGTLFMMVITTVLASIGAGGVPGGSLMLLFVILQTLGLSGEQVNLVVAIAAGINPILDMFETANNVTGDMVCTYVVARQENLIVES